MAVRPNETILLAVLLILFAVGLYFLRGAQ